MSGFRCSGWNIMRCSAVSIREADGNLNHLTNRVNRYEEDIGHDFNGEIVTYCGAGA